MSPGAGYPDVAICICTRDRPAELARALNSIAQSPVPPTEVIVSDDGDAATTQGLLDRVLPGARWVRGPRCGLGANRNSAVAVARSEYVLFLDDDAELSDEFLSTAGDCLRDHCIGGREQFILTGRERRDGYLVGPTEQDFLGYQRRPYPPGTPLKTVVINSTIFPRKLFNTMHFDTRLRYGYDEVDLASRAVAAGYRIVHCPAAVNFHQRSSLHRPEYDAHLDAARLYVTAKRRLFVERRFGAGAAFLIVASCHMLAYGLRRDGRRGLAAAARSTRRGVGALHAYARHARR